MKNISTVYTSGYQIYYNGTPCSSPPVAGRYNARDMVMRFTFVTGDTAVGKISFSSPKWTVPSGYSAGGIRWYVTTSSTSHIAANGDSEYHGTVGYSYASPYYTLSGELSGLVLEANTTYYLYLFTAGASKTCFYKYDGSGTNTAISLEATKSTVSASSITLGSSMAITINRSSTLYTHALSCLLDSGESLTITGSTGEGSYTWTPSTAQVSVIYSAMGNASSIGASICCETLYGDSSLGVSSCSVTLSANKASVSPTVTISLSGKAPTVSGVSGYIANYQSFDITATAQKRTNGADIDSVTIQYGSFIQTGTGTMTASGVAVSATGTITATVTDKRGFTGYSSYGIAVIDYTKPTISVYASPPSPTGTTAPIAISGSYFDGTLAEANTITALTLAIRDETEGTSLGTVELTDFSASGGSLAGSYDWGSSFALDYEHVYAISASATDTLGCSATAVYTVQASPVFYWGQKDFYFGVPAHGSNLCTRNYLRSTGNLKGWTHTAGYIPDSCFDGPAARMNHPSSASSGSNYCISQYPSCRFADLDGKPVTLSCDLRLSLDEGESAPTGTSNYLLFRMSRFTTDISNHSSTRTKYRNAELFYLKNLTEDWVRHSFSFTMDGDSWFTAGSSSVTTLGDYVKLQVLNYSTYYVELKDLKLELGTGSSYWSAAPEDRVKLTQSISKTASSGSVSLSLGSSDSAGWREVGSVSIPAGAKALVLASIYGKGSGAGGAGGAALTLGAYTASSLAASSLVDQMGRGLIWLPDASYNFGNSISFYYDNSGGSAAKSVTLSMYMSNVSGCVNSFSGSYGIQVVTLNGQPSEEVL